MVLGLQESLIQCFGVHLIKACICETLDIFSLKVLLDLRRDLGASFFNVLS